MRWSCQKDQTGRTYCEERISVRSSHFASVLYIAWRLWLIFYFCHGVCAWVLAIGMHGHAQVTTGI